MTEAPILILGSGRGGTTWIQDALATANGLPTIFEPLHPQAVPGSATYANRLLLHGDRAPQLKDLLDCAIDGRLARIWTRYRIRPDRLRPIPENLRLEGGSRGFVGRYRALLKNRRNYRWQRHVSPVVKLVRANLMADWLCHHYGRRILLVVRHPAAVIASRMRLWPEDWDPKPILSRYLTDDKLTSGFLQPYIPEIRQNRSNSFAHAVIWCIENLVALKQCARNSLPVVAYEHLMMNSEVAWQAVIAALELETMPDGQLRRLPSQQTRGQASSIDVSVLDKWRSQLSEDQQRDIQRALDLFKVDFYRLSDPLPHRQTGFTDGWLGSPGQLS